MNMAALEITLGMTCKKKKKSVTKVKTKKEKLEPDYEQQISWKAAATTHFSNEKIKGKEVQRT